MIIQKIHTNLPSTRNVGDHLVRLLESPNHL